MNQDTPENVFTLLIKSAGSNHGRSLQPSQVREVVDTMRAIQYEMADMHVRTEALTRFSVVLIDSHGGDITFDADEYVAAETKGLKADWNEEGTEIALSTYDVDMPDLPVGDIPTDDGDESDLAPLPEQGAEDEVEGPTTDTTNPHQQADHGDEVWIDPSE